MKIYSQTDERAISPVIGIVVILALTVSIGAIVGGAMFVVGEGTGDTTPQAEFTTHTTSDTVVITHVAGQSVDPNRIAVNEYPGEDVFTDSDGNTYEKISAGDTGEIDGNNTTSVSIQWESESGDSQQTVYSHDLSETQLQQLNGSTSDETSETESTNEPVEQPQITVVDEGFESGTYTNAFVDNSQSSVSPDVNTDRANTGDYSLDLASASGTSTNNMVKTDATYSNVSTVNVTLNKYNDGGSNNIWSVRLWSAENDGFIEVRGSGYHGGVEFREFDENRNKVTQTDVRGEFNQNEWKNVQLQIESGNVTVVADDTTQTFETELDWTQQESDVRLVANGWGGGSNIDVAYDDVVIKTYE